MPSKPFDLDKPHRGEHDPSPIPRDSHTDDAEINEMFEIAFSRRPDLEFLASLYEWWEEKGFLTARQYEALCKFTGERE